MNVKVFTILVTLWCCVFANKKYRCSPKSTLHLHKRPAYEFSVKLLQRVAEDTDTHFVYSPITTWIQLVALAEGATDETLREIWNVTRHHRHPCFGKMLGLLLRRMNSKLKNYSKRQSVIAIDALLDVKPSFIKRVRKYGTQVLLLDFNESNKSVLKVNNAISRGTDGHIDTILYYDDFLYSVMLISDANYFSNKWETRFNNGDVKPFFSTIGGKIGEVNMMTQTGYYHMLEFSNIQAKVLEIPFANNDTSVLVFLPTYKGGLEDLFYRLERTTLTSIFNLFKRQSMKLVNVELPKFKLTTEVDNLPELLFDMGIKRMFNVSAAEFRGISKFKLNTSLMTQITQIEVNEEGVTVGPGFTAKNDTKFEQFIANKPFAYMIVDKPTNFILYAGAYSTPTV